MRNETVRRVYLGGAIETSARRRPVQDKVPLLQVENVSVFYGKAQALEMFRSMSIRANSSRGRPQRRRQDHAVQHHLGFLPTAARSSATARSCRHQPARIARSGIVQCPESRELFGEMSVRENSISAGIISRMKRRKAIGLAVRAVSDPEERQNQMAQTLSGGEQQMLAIGRALMMQRRS